VTDSDQSNSAAGFLSRTVGMRPTRDAEWCQSRCASQAAVAVRRATSVTLFPSREDFPHVPARLAPTTTQQQPLVAREGKDTTPVVKVMVDKVTTRGDKEMVDKAITQEEMVVKATTQEEEMVIKATTREDKEMVDKAITQEEEAGRGIIQEARGTSQEEEDTVTTLEVGALEHWVITREYLGPGLDSTRTS